MSSSLLFLSHIRVTSVPEGDSNLWVHVRRFPTEAAAVGRHLVDPVLACGFCWICSPPPDLKPQVGAMCLQLADIIWCYSAGPALGLLFPPSLFSSCEEQKLCFTGSEAEHHFPFLQILLLKYVSPQPPPQDSPGLH